MIAKITCRACGCSKEVTFLAGQAQNVTLEHEDACPFYAAVKKGKAEKWIAKNGYPIQTLDLSELS